MSLELFEIDPPVRIRPESPMSDEEFMRFCTANEPMRLEREPDGEITVMSPSGFETGRINSRITRLLDEWAETDGRGTVTDSNGGYALPDGSVRAPDAAWIKFGKVQPLSEEQQAGFPPVSPDFVIELRSPSDKPADLRRKMQWWLDNGVELGWLIDPYEKSVTIYRPGAEPEEHVNPTSVQGTGPVAGFELVLSRIWQ